MDENQTVNNEITEIQTNNQETPVETESDADRNWKKFRLEQAQRRKELDEARRKAEEKEKEALALKQVIETMVNKPASAPSEPVEEDVLLSRKIDEAFAKKEREFEEKRKQLELEAFHKQYPDFSTIVSADNVDYLEYHHPEIASALKELPDSPGKWAKVYSLVKKFVPNPQSKEDEKRIEKNLSKPQSISTTGKSKNDMNNMTSLLSEERKKSNWERMQRVVKGV